MVLEKMDIFRKKKKESQPKLTPCTKINAKWIIDLTVKCKIIKLLEKKTGGNLWNPAFKQRVLILDTHSMIHKGQMGKLDLFIF